MQIKPPHVVSGKHNEKARMANNKVRVKFFVAFNEVLQQLKHNHESKSANLICMTSLEFINHMAVSQNQVSRLRRASPDFLVEFNLDLVS